MFKIANVQTLSYIQRKIAAGDETTDRKRNVGKFWDPCSLA